MASNQPRGAVYLSVRERAADDGVSALPRVGLRREARIVHARAENAAVRGGGM